MLRPVPALLSLHKEQFTVDELQFEAEYAVRLSEEFHGVRTCLVAFDAPLLDVEHSAAYSFQRFLSGVAVLKPDSVLEKPLEVGIGRVAVVGEVQLTLRVVRIAVQWEVLLAIVVIQTLGVCHRREDVVVLNSCFDFMIHKKYRRDRTMHPRKSDLPIYFQHGWERLSRVFK